MDNCVYELCSCHEYEYQGFNPNKQLPFVEEDFDKLLNYLGLPKNHLYNLLTEDYVLPRIEIPATNQAQRIGSSPTPH